MNYKNQSGRSMVEMLGTLVIMGVLSVGGVAGYSYGMNRYYANETAQDINLRIVDLIAQQNNGTMGLSLDAWKNEKTIYPIALVFDDELHIPLIQVSSVPQSVCEMIVKQMPSQMEVTVNSYFVDDKKDTGCVDENTMTFYMGEAEECGIGYCAGSLPICNTSTNTCVECLTAEDCGGGPNYCMNNVCEVCPSEKPVWDNANAKCVECLSDTDCEEGLFCLNSSTNHTSPMYNTCKSYSYEVILPASESPDGREWIQVKVNNSYNPSHHDAVAVCAKLGKSLPQMSELATNADGTEWIPIEDGHCHGLTRTATAIKLYSKVVSPNDGQKCIWTTLISPTVNRKSFYTKLVHGWTCPHSRAEVGTTMVTLCR